jgi:hypothetical protein
MMREQRLLGGDEGGVEDDEGSELRGGPEQFEGGKRGDAHVTSVSAAAT